MKAILMALASFCLAACAQPYSQQYTNFSAEELAAHNESLPESQQIACVDLRQGVQLSRRVCSANKRRLARLTGSGGVNRDPESGFGNYNFYVNRTGYESRRGNLPQIYFSAPPPGYDRPVIHIRDSRL